MLSRSSAARSGGDVFKMRVEIDGAIIVRGDPDKSEAFLAGQPLEAEFGFLQAFKAIVEMRRSDQFARIGIGPGMIGA